MRTTTTRRTRVGLAAALGVVAAAALVVAQGGAAEAAQQNVYGTFSLSGTTTAYSGTVTLAGGFPATSFTSTSRQATVVSGASTWLAPSTPVGAVYGSSRNRPYLNQRPKADNPTSPAVTTYTFATPTPASGWSFVLGDIDADSATISATDVNGQPVPVGGLGFQSVFNYCHQTGGPSCDSANLHDVPAWQPGTTSGTLVGNTGATDTEGASGWFSPNVALKSLTITYTQRSGFPVYQTWFVTKTQAASGTVTVNGDPYGGATVTITDASGAVVATTTSAGDGTWSVPALVSTDGYHVSVETPPGAQDQPPLAFDTLDADTPGLNVNYDIPPITVTTTVAGADGQPAADEPIVITRDGDDAPAVTTTTGDSGELTADLLPSQTYTAILDGATDQPITFTTGTTSGAIDPLVQPAPPTTTTPPGSTPPGSTPPPATVAPAQNGAAPELAFTGSEAAWPAGLGGGALVLTGVVLVLVARRRRAVRG
ncbi:carboxypeptidase-like regulatory domain-containing protein [Frondihabitans australicus]|uniref:Uncharacterized protein n=1 Tax=Frondihabitans australicus TaxID=386892 RepID=A0A495ILP1_9MICO|nr:carboxypeptidase-like regulatory domain-containing protein [Frondihabitans australicus]RKR76181.1 hypothetical protein C8E83_3346 [Frondihabitans australicus]